MINLPIVTVAGLLALWAVPESRARGHRPLDVAGIVLSILGTGSLVYGVIRGGETASWWAWGSAGMIAAGVVCLAVFVVFESRHPSPTIDVSLFRNRAFASGTLSVSLAFLTLTGGTYLLVFYSLLIRGDSALQFGLILMPVAIGSICAALGAGAMVRARGPRFTVVSGLSCLLGAFAMLYFADAETPLVFIEIALLLAGLGMGSIMGATTPLVMAVVEPAKAAAGAAANNAIRQIGAALGVAVLGSAYSSMYRSGIEGSLSAWTPLLPGEAAESLGATATALEAIGPAAAPELKAALPGLMNEASVVFTEAMRGTFLLAIALFALGCLLGALWLPRRMDEEEHPGGQGERARPEA